jgi:MFS transporter, DHA1 family, inner membrane transport protein
MRTPLVLDPLRMALGTRSPRADVASIHHGDRGSQVAFGGHVAANTYVTPFLEDVSGFRPGSISLLLVAFGIAAAIGTSPGPPSTHLPTLPVLGLAALAAVLALMKLTGETRLGATITLLA